ncbi:peptidyl-prolyl cis-trans isomerase, EpsD family [Azoarcus indigens]|uniref:EpsD family peptidyl-prolyl cis-trans isomerase n=1 Tax=Azoarcus indigens TaxID=29545 RepID=A0A4R6DJ84_9RHOO|nr:EpsD family peptidyl-prolyl cis-trans isomerase [Azoarcus indigens]NMG67411.1 peptidyl-prolyl cis-trans isomerase, EpsD family [Azoarcus indigens]TDN44168.1 EpsD family peptidyl-prolyl cis-trans isomerase [Azoarcus indigens]
MLRLGRLALPSVLLVSLTLVACSKGEADGRATFDVVAKVNDREIQSNELKTVLEHGSAASGAIEGRPAEKVLERLIDQELMVQQARDRRLDKDPRVLYSIEAARREILARAYLEQVTSESVPPSEAEIAAFYRDNPALFAERRIYSLQELQLPSLGERFDELRLQVEQAVGLQQVTEWLEAERIAYHLVSAVKPAEELPLESLPAFARMKDGQLMISQSDKGVSLIHLAASHLKPIGEKEARPLIERYISNSRKVELARSELKRLRAGAEIEYAQGGEPEVDAARLALEHHQSAAE